jgi:hypothetical protein
MKEKANKKIPNSYALQNGCYNCKYCFCKSEYDEGNEYFCTIYSKNRPYCGSVIMEEMYELHPKVQKFKEEDKRFAILHYGNTSNDYINCYKEWNTLSKNAYITLMNKWENWSKNRKVASFGICNK